MLAHEVTGEFNQPPGTSNAAGVLVTRLMPPPQQTRLLARPRIDAILSAAVDYPLTLVVAPAGSGKTTALAGFASRSGWPTIWCRMSPHDDPLTLLLHLVTAFRSIFQFDEEFVRSELARKGADPDILVNELATIMRQETMLILDDYHEADEFPLLRALVERLIGIQPVRLHMLLASRYEPSLLLLPTARARGEVYEIQQSDLAYTVEETQDLFLLNEQQSPLDIADITTICRGWPLAMQMLATGQSLPRIPDLPTKDLSESSVYSLEEIDAQTTHHDPIHASPFPPTHLPSHDFDTTESFPTTLRTLLPLLDEYLTRQVFDQQPPAIQEFLLRTTELRWLDHDVCRALPTLATLVPKWSDVERRRLFFEPIMVGQMRYQPLFRGYLQRLAAQRTIDHASLHREAVTYYHSRNDYEGVVHHLLAIGAHAQAVDMLEQASGEWLKQGRALSLLEWIDRLPNEYHTRPTLLEARAAAYRRLARFDQALALYEQAEASFEALGDRRGQARSLRGRAEVYLDTVQPAPAVTLLKRALKLLPVSQVAERADILRLQAENWANRGRADIALLLETTARRWVQERRRTDERVGDHPPTDEPTGPAPGEHTSLLLSRLLLRSGRLNESRVHLEADLGVDSVSAFDHETIPLAHRQPSLLLALVYALLGAGPKALAMARRGLLEAHQRGSKLTEAIAHMRVGHAYQVITPLDNAAANRHYRQAIDLVQMAGVTRTRVEGYMGLGLLHGHSGDLGAAEVVVREGLKIAEESGDEWIVALLWLALGSAAVAVNDERAPEWLSHANQRFRRGSDSYGQAVISLWMALWYRHANDGEQLIRHVTQLIELTRQHGYEGLLTSPTLFGPRDMAMLIPLLLVARSLPEHSSFAQRLLRQAFPTVASDDTVQNYHPGYTIHIQMLGTFRVWRGIHEIHAREWQREKARQLLQLLLTYRGQWLQREQICLWLWPDSDLEAAERQFKVTLNALNTALEPLRPARTTPFFVRRQGLAYSFAPSYGCWIDVDEFELRTTIFPQSDPEFVLRNSQIAVQLYRGDYLVESLYDPWTLEERERLLARYLATVTTLAEKLVEKGDMQQAVHLCERVLRRERCYEEAYQVLMRAYAGIGSRIQAMRTYTRCVQAMEDELGIEPLPETTELYERIKRNEKP